MTKDLAKDLNAPLLGRPFEGSSMAAPCNLPPVKDHRYGQKLIVVLRLKLAQVTRPPSGAAQLPMKTSEEGTLQRKARCGARRYLTTLALSRPAAKDSSVGVP